MFGTEINKNKLFSDENFENYEFNINILSDQKPSLIIK